jgi:hypothetical protein
MLPQLSIATTIVRLLRNFIVGGLLWVVDLLVEM